MHPLTKLFSLAVALALTLVSACTSGGHCDHDQTYAHGLCIEPIVDAGAVPGDAGFDHYGDTCVDPARCAAPTNFCMIEFGEDTGYCTATGCTVDADCPDGWRCTDLSVLLPGEPPLCTKQ